MGGRSARRQVVTLALAAIAVGSVLAGCVGPTTPSPHQSGASEPPPPEIDQVRAGQLAHDYFGSADAHGEGSMVFDVKVSTPVLGTSKLGRPVWKVQVEGDVSDPGKTVPAYHSVMWLEVDAASGAITITAQG